MLVLYIILVLAVIYVVAFSVLSSVRYARNYTQDLDGKESDSVPSSDEMNELIAQRAFLESRLRLIDIDSVSLSVNLADSSISIEQNGVVLHSAAISFIQASRVFKRIDRDELTRFLAAPLTVHESFSTIPKYRYTVKVAPSDTAAPAPMVTPDTASRETVCFLLTLDRGIQLDIRQEEEPDRKIFRHYKRQVKTKESNRIFNDLIAFRVPDHHPVIRIEIPEKDARTIYKALPVHAKIAIRI
jgi:hypothetical protein